MTSFSAHATARGSHSPVPPQPVQLAARSILFDEKEAAGHLYEIVYGSVLIAKMLPDGRRQILDILCDGDFAGLTPHPQYGCTAIALTGCRLRRIARADAGDCAVLQSRLTRFLFNHNDAHYAHALLLSRKSALERIATFLLGASQRIGPDGEVRAAAVHLTLSELSDYLGLRSETVCRYMSLLRDKEIVARGRHGATIVLDRAALERLSAGHAPEGTIAGGPDKALARRAVRQSAMKGTLAKGAAA